MNQEEREVMYIERLHLISCLSSKEASFVKDMHDCGERTPIRQSKNNERFYVQSRGFEGLALCPVGRLMERD